MPLSKQAKKEAVDSLSSLLATSKMTVMANYSGVNVAQLQELRASARENQVTVRVAKNRLFKVALSKVDALKELDMSGHTGQTLYAFCDYDEVMPAQLLDKFAKQYPNMEFVGAINAEGELIDAELVKQLASLPSKDQLRGQLVGVIAGPMSGFVNVLSGNIRGLINVLNAKAEATSA